ncbi:unnamed protein product [Microthlaspi erraticum]|uniref:Uncharacterized protein n=1 Tax=Microthlaspi erraticum TaxID=1685480 RepID=A0A6D2K8D9_9BRAS|nr:unnamed protein product [Microthlaspi erraticum]
MDFIKTSSLRALIELTFQRNWNGLIWMSRKGVIPKEWRLSRRLYRETAPNRAVRLAEERMFRARPKLSVRLKSRPKSKPLGRSRITTRETQARGRPRHNATPHRARPKRASRENASRPRNSLAYRARTLRPSRGTPASGREISSAKSIRSTTPADRESVRPDRSDSHDPTVRPIVPTTVPTPRSTRSPF